MCVSMHWDLVKKPTSPNTYVPVLHKHKGRATVVSGVVQFIRLGTYFIHVHPHVHAYVGGSAFYMVHIKDKLLIFHTFTCTQYTTCTSKCEGLLLFCLSPYLHLVGVLVSLFTGEGVASRGGCASGWESYDDLFSSSFPFLTRNLS